jgi:hypothetical protein
MEQDRTRKDHSATGCLCHNGSATADPDSVGLSDYLAGTAECASSRGGVCVGHVGIMDKQHEPDA